MSIDLTPDPDEIVQAEEHPYETKPIPTTVCGPVETRELPASGHPGYKTDQAVGTAVAVRLFPMEPRRKYGVILPVSQDLYIATSQAGAQSGAAGAMRIPAVVPYVIGHVYEVWACAVAATTDVGTESVKWSE